MPNIFRGKAQVSGTVFVADVILYPWPESMDLNHEFQEDIIHDTSGGDAAWRSRNEMITGELGMVFVDQSSSSTAAHAAAGAAFFAPYAILTISTCAVVAWNTTWQVVSGASINQKNTDTAKGKFRLRRYVDSTQNTLAATIPS
jgi:hypothetical protein